MNVEVYEENRSYCGDLLYQSAKWLLFSERRVRPIEKLYSAAVSGGSYEGYLAELKTHWHRGCALFAARECLRFSLPCKDGLGTLVSEEQLPQDLLWRYSPMLCALFATDGASVYLRDDDFSVAEKRKAAEKYGILPVIVRR